MGESFDEVLTVLRWCPPVAANTDGVVPDLPRNHMVLVLSAVEHLAVVVAEQLGRDGRQVAAHDLSVDRHQGVQDVLDLPLLVGP
ncbi:hypothetical protein [Candidatus Poriferisocius sp.]|uniref:hypothetical protein n=1 Tax=Candidatus Poriferisocius sp. TaxID=3101276 RepID=UPI003B5B6447